MNQLPIERSINEDILSLLFLLFAFSPLMRMFISLNQTDVYDRKRNKTVQKKRIY